MGYGHRLQQQILTSHPDNQVSHHRESNTEAEPPSGMSIIADAQNFSLHLSWSCCECGSGLDELQNPS